MTYLLIALALVVLAYVLANLRWQTWDAERRLDRITTRLVRERITEQYRI